MVTKPDKFNCPVCGKEVQKQGLAMHNKSKFHTDALAKQQQPEQQEQPQNQEVQQTKPAPTITQKPEIKPEVKQTKIESVPTTKPEPPKQEDKQDGEYTGLEWD